MTIYTTTPKQRIYLSEIVTLMSKSGLPVEFIDKAALLANVYEGAYDLMKLWANETEQDEKDQIIADLQEEIDSKEEAHNRVFKSAKINFDELDKNIKDVLAFKKGLRVLVDNWGGVSKLAQVTGIPQPSLSRFFNSGSLPRNTTIYKIMEALTEDGNTSFSWHPPFTIDQLEATMSGGKGN